MKEAIHLHPFSGYFYRGGFTELNTCTDCSAIGDSYSLHTINVCHLCGGKVVKGLVGRWIFKGNWFERNILSKGYWELTK